MSFNEIHTLIGMNGKLNGNNTETRLMEMEWKRSKSIKFI